MSHFAWPRIFHDPLANPWIALCLLVAVFVAVLYGQSHKPTEVNVSEDLGTLETNVPLGFVLVPVVLANHEAVDALIGNRGTVDLFGGESRLTKLATQVTLLRAPFDQNQFGVLVPEADASEIVRYAGPLFAVIQPERQGKARVLRPSRQRIFVDESWEEGG